MTIDKADDNDVDIVIAIDNNDDTTANNNNNNIMTNDITVEIEADTSAAAVDNTTAEMMTNDIKIELDEEAPPFATISGRCRARATTTTPTRSSNRI